jgi:hypothetical protein
MYVPVPLTPCHIPSAPLSTSFLFSVFSLSSRLDSRSCQTSYFGAREYPTTPPNKITPLTRSKTQGGRQDSQRIPTRGWRDTAFGSCSTWWLLDRCNITILVLRCCASRTHIRLCADATSCLVLIWSSADLSTKHFPTGIAKNGNGGSSDTEARLIVHLRANDS